MGETASKPVVPKPAEEGPKKPIVSSSSPQEMPPKVPDGKMDDSSSNPLEIPEHSQGALRGVAAAMRRAMLTSVKQVLVAKGPAAKQAARVVGENRTLAFASEGAVAGEALLPRVLYYGAWGLSGTAIAADIYNKQDDAPENLKFNTVLYWTAFHIPASLVVPAVIIHRIVHTVEDAVKNPKGMAKSWPPRSKAIAPVAAALFSIVPVVPVVDHAAEAIMEPTLGKYLGLSFEDHHGGGSDDDGGSGTAMDSIIKKKEE